MTKRFCDLCGKSAVENYQQFDQDGCSPFHGKKVGVRAIFESYWERGNTTGSDPVDLCASCQCDLLRRLIDQIQGDPVA